MIGYGVERGRERDRILQFDGEAASVSVIRKMAAFTGPTILQHTRPRISRLIPFTHNLKIVVTGQTKQTALCRVAI